MSRKKIALVHEYLTRNGGAERVLGRLKSLFSQTDIFTLLYDPQTMAEKFPPDSIYTSFLQKLPEWLKRNPKILGLLAPSAIESLDLSKYELILSSSNSFAKGIISKPKATHICYCHAPSAFVWDGFYAYRKSQRGHGLIHVAMTFLAHYLRQWDKQASDRVDYFIANSLVTQKRIKKFYRRDSIVVYPPVNVQRFQPTPDHNNSYLIVSQLTPYKNIDLAIEVCNKMEWPLTIIGEGKDRKRLEALAGPTITFLGYVSDEEVIEYYQSCKAFLFPGEDDFGIAPVEAMAAGKPVIALRAGGALETVIEGVTGEFFDAPVPELLADAIRRVNEHYDRYNHNYIRKHSEQFSEEVFDKNITSYIQKILGEKRKRSTTLADHSLR